MVNKGFVCAAIVGGASGILSAALGFSAITFGNFSICGLALGAYFLGRWASR